MTDTTPTASEQYNGWTNRETWALNLWLSNDEGLYNMARERVAEALADYRRPSLSDTQPRVAGEAVKALWDEITDPDEGYWPGRSAAVVQMMREVGSAWRIDWDEIGAAWLEGLDES